MSVSVASVNRQSSYPPSLNMVRPRICTSIILSLGNHKGWNTYEFIQSSFRVWLVTLVDNILDDPESKGNADSIQFSCDHAVHISLCRPHLPICHSGMSVDATKGQYERGVHAS
jgi:hypothetical protein